MAPPTIPEAVTSIGNSAFEDCSSLTALNFNAENCTSCGSSKYPAFPSSVATLTLGEKVTKLPAYAFCGCSSLTALNFNAENCTSCGSSKYPAFPSSVATLTLGEKVTKLPAYAFCGCSSLTSVTIPEAVRSIGDSAFSGCSNLAELTFNAENCTSCGSSNYPAFPRSVATLTLGEKVTKLPAYAFCGCSSLTSVTIPEAVRSIDEGVFCGCYSLTSVTIPEAVTSISSSAFSRCSSLTSINIPEAVTSIGDGAFSGCSSLTSVTIPEAVTSIGSYAFSGCSSLTSVTIPEAVTSIGFRAFSYCSSLTALNFNAENCTSCGSSNSPAFPSSVTTLTLGEKVTMLPAYAFYDCSNIERVIIPNAVLNIGERAFYNNRLKSVTIGAGVQTVGSNAFYRSSGNGRIAKALWLGNTPPSNLSAVNANVNYVANDRYSFSNQIKYEFLSSTFTVDGAVYVPVSPTERTCDLIDCSYDTAVTNIHLTDKISNKGIELTVKNIGQYAFYANDYLTDLEISNNGNIGTNAFYGCSKIANLKVANSGSVGESAFSNCSSLVTANISNSGSIGNSAFSELKLLSNVILGDSVSAINSNAFYGCKSISELTIPNSVAELGESAFEGCSALKNITIGSGMLSLPSRLFYGCSSLETMTVPNNILTIGDFVFSGCISLTDISFQDLDEEEDKNVLTVGSNGSNPLFSSCPLDEVYIGRKLRNNTSSNNGYSPFYRNTSLRSVEISDAETGISDNEFYGCSNLKSITIGNGVTSIGNWAFSGCSALDYFSAGFNVKTIGQEAFSDCTALTNYHSFSIEPPVCGSQALDDINKWECTLFVPAESSDEYAAADQWKDFFFVNETDAVIIESLTLSPDIINGLTGDTAQIEAEITPANATRRTLNWTSEDESVATVNEYGLVTLLKEGATIITARTTDGSSLSAAVNVLVSLKNPELGDSNANGTVNIADAVNTANYAIGNEVAYIDVVAADVNQDGKITLSDANATISLILDQSSTVSTISKAPAISKASSPDMLIIDNLKTQIGDTMEIGVRLNDSHNYVALQADIIMPEGVSLLSVNKGLRIEDTHTLISKRINERILRVAIFDASNKVFADNDEPLLILTVNAESGSNDNIIIANAIAADMRACEYKLSYDGDERDIMTGSASLGEKSVKISAEKGNLMICNAADKFVTVYNAEGFIVAEFKALSDMERIEVPTGVYVVTADGATTKLYVK